MCTFDQTVWLEICCMVHLIASAHTLESDAWSMLKRWRIKHRRNLYLCSKNWNKKVGVLISNSSSLKSILASREPPEFFFMFFFWFLLVAGLSLLLVLVHTSRRIWITIPAVLTPVFSNMDRFALHISCRLLDHMTRYGRNIICPWSLLSFHCSVFCH